MVTLILLWALGHGLLDQGFARKYPCSTNLLDQMEEAVVLALDSHGAGGGGSVPGRAGSSGQSAFTTHTGQIKQGSSPSGAHRRFC